MAYTYLGRIFSSDRGDIIIGDREEYNVLLAPIVLYSTPQHIVHNSNSILSNIFKEGGSRIINIYWSIGIKVQRQEVYKGVAYYFLYDSRVRGMVIGHYIHVSIIASDAVG